MHLRIVTYTNIVSKTFRSPVKCALSQVGEPWNETVSKVTNSAYLFASVRLFCAAPVGADDIAIMLLYFSVTTAPSPQFLPRYVFGGFTGRQVNSARTAPH